jgi:7,8-dihydropterin-6-yl-methyl-4-(beta-D-ribofuranosyl)aminobenzene 5'-phosphate synthase
MKQTTCWTLALAWLGILAPEISMAQAAPRITILVDAFGTPSPLRQDWGFSALVEHEGKRILFDTGNNADLFAHNTRLLGVDLTRLDAVVISHRHNDHTDGLHHLLELNPHVRIYAPNDEYFGGPTPAIFFQDSIPSLPQHMRYFGGAPPKAVPHGSPWKHATIERVDSVTEIAPGITVVRNRSSSQGFPETPEISLAIQTPEGQVLLVGCSHPGIEQILNSVAAKQVPVRLLVGGLHLLTTPEAEVDRVVHALREEWRIGEVAPGHCTGERAFARLHTVFGNRYRYAGVGTVIELP